MGRGVSQHTRALIDKALDLWEHTYRPIGITPTVRQLFYALAVEGLVEKSERGYGKVQRTLAAARERGDFPWEAIHDGLRQVQEPSTWPNLSSFFETVRRSYRFDKWALQPRRVEVWLEKDTLSGTVAPVVEDFDVPLLVGRGYTSLSAKYEACQRIDSRPLTILYIGDHDPSGRDMWEGAVSWLRAGCKAFGAAYDLAVELVAITDEDHGDQAMPHLPVNGRDSRAKAYRRRYGDGVVEVEALPPEALQARLREVLERHLDHEAWQESLALEAAHCARLQQAVSELTV